MSPLQVENVPLSSIIRYARNARMHDQEQVKAIAASITEFGWTYPVLIDRDNVIVAGHGRALAAELLGLTEVPCLRRSDLTPAQVKAYRLADNQLALRSSWDVDLLKLELEEIKLDGFEIGLLGFDLGALQQIGIEPGDAGGGGDPGAADRYTKKIEAPIYEPKSETPPPISDLADCTKCNKLGAAISAADIPSDVKSFLHLAVGRHVVFNYERIAEFYAHASKEVQELMEASALVIIDFDKAIENGFVALSDDLAEAYTK